MRSGDRRYLSRIKLEWAKLLIPVQGIFTSCGTAPGESRAIHDMTTLTAGKLPLDAQVFLNDEELTDAQVFLHLKGYARATVTHLDLEHPSLAGLIPLKARTFIWIIGIENGLLIRTERNDTVKVLSSQLTTVLPQGQKTRTCVGGKANGLFIGFRRPELRKLEALVG